MSKILISISQLPTPGPPRRVLTGRVRLCRVSPFGMTDGASFVLTDSPFGVKGGVKWEFLPFLPIEVPFLTGRLPSALDEGADW